MVVVGRLDQKMPGPIFLSQSSPGELIQVIVSSFKNTPISEDETGFQIPLCLISPSFNSS